MKVIAGLLLAASAICMSAPAHADVFPSRPVTIVVPFTPGASNDMFGRYLANALSKEWNQRVLVENRPGGGGSIGVARISKSPPDGYNLVFGSTSLAVNPAALKDLPYDPIADIQPVSMVAIGHLLVVTGTRVPMATVADIVKQAKSQKIFYGSNGPGVSSFAAELLNQTAGIKMENVSHQGGSEVLVDMVGGRIDLYVGDALTLSPSIAGKKVTAVATLNSKRLNTLPDVPTIAEAGFPNSELAIWWGLFAPANTPKDVLAKINDGVKKVMSTPEAIEFLGKSSASPGATTVEDFTKRYQDDVAKFKAIAKAQGFTP